MKSIFHTILAFLSLHFSWVETSKKEGLPPDTDLWKKYSYFHATHPQERVYLQTDKPYYLPGETVWFSVFLRNASHFSPKTISDVVKVEWINPKGEVVQRWSLEPKNGIGIGDFVLSKTAIGGIYKLKCYSEWQKNEHFPSFFEKEIIVQSFLIPPVKMKLDFEKKSYGEGENVTVNLLLESNENLPLAGYSLEYTVEIEGEEWRKKSEKTDNKGKAILDFALPKNLNSPDGLINVRFRYQGKIEAISRSIPIELQKLNIVFFPEGGDFAAGCNQKIAFKSINSHGKPADIRGFILDSKGKKRGDFVSFHQGMGAFFLKASPQFTYEMHLTHPFKQVVKLPIPLSNIYRLAVTIPEKNQAHVSVFAPLEGRVYLLGTMRGKPYYFQKLTVKKGENLFNIPLENLPSGILQFTLFDENQLPINERLVMINTHRQLAFKISTDKEKYLPREKVIVTIETLDSAGKPVAADFSLSVVDDALLSFADDKSSTILSWLLAEAEIKEKVEDPTFYFDPKEPKASAALDYLMLTAGWRKFEWEEILADSSSQPKYAPEQIQLSGRITDNADRGIAYAQLYFPSQNQYMFTNEKGDFTFLRNTFTTYPFSFFVTVPGIIPQKITVKSPNSKIYIRMIKQQNLIMAIDTLKGSLIDTLRLYNHTKIPVFSKNMQIEGHFLPNISDNTQASFLHAQAESNQVLLLQTLEENHKALENTKDKREIEKIRNTILLLEQRIAEYTTSFLPSVDINKVEREEQPKYEAVTKTVMVAPGEYKTVTEQILVKESSKKIHLPPSENKNEGDLPQIQQWDIPVFEKDHGAQGTDIKGGRQGNPLGDTQPIVTTSPKVTTSPATTTTQVPSKPNQAPTSTSPTQYDEVTKGGKTPDEDPNPNQFIPVTKKPEPLNMQEVVSQVAYPTIAKEGGIEGDIILKVLVDKEGKYVKHTILKTIHPVLVREVEKHIASLTFNPAMQGNNPISFWQVIPFSFRLNPEHSHYQEATKYGFYKARVFPTPTYTHTDSVGERNDFRTTLYWNGRVHTDSMGKIQLSFYNGDKESSFQITTEGISAAGEIGRGVYKYFTQLPFGIQTQLPPTLIAEDTVNVPVTLINRTVETQTGRIAAYVLGQPSPLTPLFNESDLHITLPPQGSTTVYLPFKVENLPNTYELHLNYMSGRVNEKSKHVFQVISRGYPFQFAFSGEPQSQSFEWEGKALIPQSLKAELIVYPNLAEEMMSGIESILREPHGCFEQTTSATYPNLLVLQYLQQVNKANPAIQQKALDLIKKGYERLLTFECKEGGFDWFGKSPAHEGLTAYGLMEFTEMKKVYQGVDEKMVQRTMEWLLSRRDSNGNFQLNLKGVDGFRTANKGTITPFVIYALSEIGNFELKKEMEICLKEALDTQNPYLLGLMANTLFNCKDNRAEFILEKMEEIIPSFVNEKLYTASGSSGKWFNTEVTALALMANTKRTHKNMAKMEAYAQSLRASRQANGGFGNSSATVMALRALIRMNECCAKGQNKGSVSVWIDGEKVGEKAYTEESYGPILIGNLSSYLEKGSHRVEVQFSDSTAILPYTFRISGNQYYPENPSHTPVSLTLKPNKSSLKEGETLHLSVSLQNHEPKDQPMTMAIVGFPSGLRPQIWQLKEMQEKNVFDYYEINDNELILYYRSLTPSATKHLALDLKAEITGNYRAPASSAYLYYNPETKFYTTLEKMEITQDRKNRP